MVQDSKPIHRRNHNLMGTARNSKEKVSCGRDTLRLQDGPSRDLRGLTKPETSKFSFRQSGCENWLVSRDLVPSLRLGSSVGTRKVEVFFLSHNSIIMDAIS